METITIPKENFDALKSRKNRRRPERKFYSKNKLRSIHHTSSRLCRT
ncbi:TPA: hypothetical protein ACFOBB_001333 [Neisseria meningitidis]|nr:hypothetical protein [Neisseria meningitidis]MCL6065905.1 hypothetical protein [Neisseria meningitidis]